MHSHTKKNSERHAQLNFVIAQERSEEKILEKKKFQGFKKHNEYI